jgi:hypothetical protein
MQLVQPRRQGKGLQDDRHFKSINVQSLWYKTDPFILSSQAKTIFYIQDTSLGNDWRVVQKFEHRNIYDVAEKDEGSHDVHQDDYHSDTEHVVQDGGEDVPLPNIQVGEATIIECNLQEFIGNKKEAAIIDVGSEDEEKDETVLQYCSDDDNDNNNDMSPDDEDEDF